MKVETETDTVIKKLILRVNLLRLFFNNSIQSHHSQFHTVQIIFN